MLSRIVSNGKYCLVFKMNYFIYNKSYVNKPSCHEVFHRGVSMYISHCIFSLLFFRFFI